MEPKLSRACHLLSEGGQDKSKTYSLDESGDGFDSSVLDWASLSKHGRYDARYRGCAENDEAKVSGTLVRYSPCELEQRRDAVCLEPRGDEGRRVDGHSGLCLLCLPELRVLVL